jgi:dynein heavy chain
MLHKLLSWTSVYSVAGESLDAALDGLLGKQFRKSISSIFVRIGDADVEVSNSFKMYDVVMKQTARICIVIHPSRFITTKLPNPHYSPEMFSRVSVINFTITPDGLLDQLLCVTVEKASFCIVSIIHSDVSDMGSCRTVL